MSGLVVVALVLTLAAVLFVLHPIVSGRGASLEGEDEPERSETEARKRAALLALRDVEYDFATGKLDDEDYRRLKTELAREALEAIREEEAGGGAGGEPPPAGPAGPPPEDELEREIARAREALRKGTGCPGCGHRNPPGSRFCSNCGAPLGARAPAGG